MLGSRRPPRELPSCFASWHTVHQQARCVQEADSPFCATAILSFLVMTRFLHHSLFLVEHTFSRLQADIEPHFPNQLVNLVRIDTMTLFRKLGVKLSSIRASQVNIFTCGIKEQVNKSLPFFSILQKSHKNYQSNKSDHDQSYNHCLIVTSWFCPVCISYRGESWIIATEG